MRMKMALLIFYIVGLCCVQLFPLITSRVEGRVFDKETDNPIIGASAYLISYEGPGKTSFRTRETQTDKNGKFVFDDVRQGRYFVEIYKEGYSTFCPLYLLNEDHDQDKFQVFPISEGEVKHLVIKMEKGGGLKITIYKKDATGLSVYPDCRIEIGKYSQIQDGKTSSRYSIGQFETDENGICMIDGLIPGEKYCLLIMEEGFPFLRKDVLIKRGEMIEESHIFDFADITGISGKITFSKKSVELPVLYATVALFDINSNVRITELYVTDQSEYFIKNVIPGKYKFHAIAVYDDDSEVCKDIIVTIESGKTSQVDLDL